MGQAAVMADTPFAHGCPCGRGVCPTLLILSGAGGDPPQITVAARSAFTGYPWAQVDQQP